MQSRLTLETILTGLGGDRWRRKTARPAACKSAPKVASSGSQPDQIRGAPYRTGTAEVVLSGPFS